MDPLVFWPQSISPFCQALALVTRHRSSTGNSSGTFAVAAAASISLSNYRICCAIFPFFSSSLSAFCLSRSVQVVVVECRIHPLLSGERVITCQAQVQTFWLLLVLLLMQSIAPYRVSVSRSACVQRVRGCEGQDGRPDQTEHMLLTLIVSTWISLEFFSGSCSPTYSPPAKYKSDWSMIPLLLLMVPVFRVVFWSCFGVAGGLCQCLSAVSKLPLLIMTAIHLALSPCCSLEPRSRELGLCVPAANWNET